MALAVVKLAKNEQAISPIITMYMDLAVVKLEKINWQ